MATDPDDIPETDPCAPAQRFDDDSSSADDDPISLRPHNTSNPASAQPAQETTTETDATHEESGEMTLLEHLEDLRGTLIRSAIALFVGVAVIAVFLPAFADLLRWPLEFAFGEKRILDEGLITTSPLAVFSVVLQVTFLGGFALSLPFILYFVAMFIAPGLTPRELAILRPGCLAALFLFLLGASFAFFILVPAALKASMFFNDMFDFRLLWSADRYFSLIMWMTLGIGFMFEFPLLLVSLVYVRILTAEQLEKHWPYAIIGFLSLAAVITPTTDPFTFLLLAMPMTGLYFAAVAVSKRVERYLARRDLEEAR